MASNKSRGLLARLRSSASRGLASVKELGVTPGGNVGWTVRSGGARSTFYAGSDVDWEERAGTLWLNSAVSLCAGFLFNKVCEPSLEVRRTSAGRAGAKEEAVPEHPLLALLARPNPEYSGNALLQAVALSYKAKGNAYVVKVRDAGGLGAPRELWYVPHWQMEPLEPSGGGPTEFYRHTVGGKSKYYPRRDVIHLKFGMDPEKPRLGFDPSRAQLAGVVSDTQVDVYTATILTGLGVIGAFVSPATSGDKISPEQAGTGQGDVAGADHGRLARRRDRAEPAREGGEGRLDARGDGARQDRQPARVAHLRLVRLRADGDRPSVREHDLRQQGRGAAGVDGERHHPVPDRLGRDRHPGAAS